MVPAKKPKSAPRSTPKPRRKKTIRARAKGTLATVGILLIASGVLRLTTGASEAFAREGTEEDSVVQEVVQTEEQTQTVVEVQRVTRPELRALLEALQTREARVNKLEMDIKMRMQALRLAEREIDEKLVQLTEAENRLRETLSFARGASDRDIEQLTNVYANMKPKQAAALFAEMEPEFAAGFLGRMRPEAAAAIMAGLDPRTAYSFSVLLAGRHADVPK
ncbi:MotE family protein [Cognatishimia sp. F0-27]|uniref:MotE family protein n=1 Tax=Cognatishimia sp. F0-27 TaxID=2816855 RepID=UPI001D0C5689|nr:hypothetical protein [Cognatishimia sp. F0-27]MCC1491348.1 hypothetical protein [Cognatishimia sp. F0-27]